MKIYRIRESLKEVRMTMLTIQKRWLIDALCYSVTWTKISRDQVNQNDLTMKVRLLYFDFTINEIELKIISLESTQ